jgi:hypothetical protein
MWFFNGICKEYSESYPECLEGSVSEDEWHKCINKINDCGITYFPCIPALVIGYVLSLLTCCISLCIPMCCASDMHEQMDRHVKELNDTLFKPRGLLLKFKVKCLRTSWFEIWRNDSAKLFETVVTEESFESFK